MIKVIPEINYYFSKNSKNLNIDFDYQFKYDDYFSEEIIHQNSFLNLLFSDDIPYNDIVINFKKYGFNDLKNPALKRRLSVYQDFYFYLCDINGENIFELNDNDILFLNILLDFKKQIFNYNIDDYTPETPLSKLIYFYINYKKTELIDISITYNLNYDNNNDFYYLLGNTYNLFILKKILKDYK